LKKVAIIVSGGNGSRMQTDTPKQFLEINGKPILLHTLEKFFLAAADIEIFLVLNVDHQAQWNKIAKKFKVTIPYTLVNGGRTRYHSVKNALKLIPKKSIIAVHDGVRPLVSTALILRGFEQANNHKAIVTAIPAKDSIRRLHDGISAALPREEIYLVQTPQLFDSSVLLKAYQQAYRNEFSDDAAVVERSGIPIHILLGETQNIKITYPEDILFAENILKLK
jgi:2-C-methyl-D-erythritol 4-phosphate cytidylyltransferase